MERSHDVFYNEALRLVVFRNNGPQWWYRKGTRVTHRGPFGTRVEAITAAQKPERPPSRVAYPIARACALIEAVDAYLASRIHWGTPVDMARDGSIVQQRDRLRLALDLLQGRK